MKGQQTPGSTVYKLMRWVGGVIAVVALLVGVLVYGAGEFDRLRRPGLTLILSLQFLVGLFMAHAAALKQRRIDIGEKMYPASIAAAVLYLACLLRWLWY